MAVENITIGEITVEFNPAESFELGEDRENPFAIMKSLDENSSRIFYWEKLRRDAKNEAEKATVKLRILTGEIRIDLKRRLAAHFKENDPKAKGPTIGEIDNAFDVYYEAYARGLADIDNIAEEHSRFIDIDLLKAYVVAAKEARAAEDAEGKLNTIVSEQKSRLSALKEMARLEGNLIGASLLPLNRVLKEDKKSSEEASL